jgi:hypothetical protein
MLQKVTVQESCSLRQNADNTEKIEKTKERKIS